MRKILVFSLTIILGVFVYLLVDVKKENVSLKCELDDKLFKRQTIIDKQNEYRVKEEQLNKLKEEKKNQVLKYEEVRLWNEEISGYLD